MRESYVEHRLVEAVNRRGGICPKWVSPGWDGAPDRIVLFPEGRIAFVEVKRPGGKVRNLQKYRHKILRLLGFRVYIIDTPEGIDDVLDEIEGRKED